MIISSWNFDLQYSYGQSFNDFDSTSYLKKNSNTLFPLISAALLTLRSEKALLSNKRFPVISVAPQNAALIRNLTIYFTKMKFSIKDFSSKCDQIRSFLRIWSYLLKKSLMENFIFCPVIN